MPYAGTWMDLEIITLSVVSQTKTNSIQYHSCMGSNKNNTKEHIYKIEMNSQISKSNLYLPKGKLWGGGINWKDGINICILLYRE